MFLNPRTARNKSLTSINNSNIREILVHRRNMTVPVDTVIQKITDEYGMLEDITIEISSTVQIVGS